MATFSKHRITVLCPLTREDFRAQSLDEIFTDAEQEVTSIFLKAGPASVESAVDEVLAGPGLIAAAVEAEAEGADALVIDCMLDPALDAVREAVAIPVVGSGEANMVAAAQPRRKFSIVTVLDRQERMFRQKAKLYGLGDALVSVRSIAVPVLELSRDAGATLKRTVREAAAAICDEGAEAIVFGCTGMLGLGKPVGQNLQAMGLDVPVFDPLPYAVECAVKAAREGETHSKTDYPYPERKGLEGFSDWPTLGRLLEPVARAR